MLVNLYTHSDQVRVCCAYLMCAFLPAKTLLCQLIINKLLNSLKLHNALLPTRLAGEDTIPSAQDHSFRLVLYFKTSSSVLKRTGIHDNYLQENFNLKT